MRQHEGEILVLGRSYVRILTNISRNVSVALVQCLIQWN